MYSHVKRPAPQPGGSCKIQGKGGTCIIEEVRNRSGRVGIKTRCSKRYYSGLSARMVDEDPTCEKCKGTKAGEAGYV